MKNKELEVFEKDDWLSKERLRESRISAWDFDDARKLRNEHQDGCDVKKGASMHHFEHLQSNFKGQRSLRQIDGSKNGEAEFWFFLDIVLLVFLFIFNSIFSRYSFIPAMIVLFLGINPGIFVWLLLFKRFPPKAYSKALFLIALLLQFLGSAYNAFRYYR